MKSVMVTLLGVIVLAFATASAAFGAQTSELSSAIRALPDSLIRGALQGEISGNVLGIGSLPTTSTGGGMDGLVLVIGAFAAISGAVVLVRKAIADS